LAEVLEKAGVPNARIHGNRSQSARTDALGGFKDGRYRVLVATDIVAHGIDVEALEHVVNFDVPNQPEDYIHRVGRTGRAEATGDAITLVSPDEERSIASIERAIGKKLSRLKLDGFDYAARPTERFEIPIGERIAEIRRRKAEDRERARLKAERKAQAQAREGRGRQDNRRGDSSNGRDGRSGSAPRAERNEQGGAPARNDRNGTSGDRRRVPAGAAGRGSHPRGNGGSGRDGGGRRP